jgi:hypothetical protein
MPFEKIKSGKNKGKYVSPKGHVFTQAQVNLYYANGGHFPGEDEKKSSNPLVAHARR